RFILRSKREETILVLDYSLRTNFSFCPALRWLPDTLSVPRLPIF
ncbi:MAG: hypothetical protein RLZZ69_2688, partial [Cyanobacteriota bacterium]